MIARTLFLTISAFLFLTLPTTLSAQCSDAGVCAIGAHDADGKHTIDANYIFGYSGKDDDLTFNTIEVGGQFSILESSRVDVLMPWSSISGPLGSTNGIRDLIVLWNQQIPGLRENTLTASIGGRFATGESNGDSLPQAYQPGLGTNDLLLGVTYETDAWNFGLGYQLSNGRSDNAITRLKRGDDVLGRVGYDFALGNTEIGLQALAIKRLDKSSVLDSKSAQPNEAFVDVPDSDQFQINLLASAAMPLSPSFGIQGFVAIPFIKREVNVDGLTRAITISVGAQFTP